MSTSNVTEICEEIDLLFDTSSKCFEDAPLPNITDCDLLILIHRLILIDCYIERILFPLTGSFAFVGTVLNLFSLYCFLKMNKRNSQNVYLSFLSLGDTINLQINFTIPLLRHIEFIDEYFHNSSILCRINGFLTEFFLIFPTWIIVLLTFERLICVLSPLKCHSVYTHRRAKISIFVLVLIVMSLSSYRIYGLKGIDQMSVFSIVACVAESFPQLQFIQIFNLFIWAILPELLTLAMNLIIIYNIKRATQRFEPFYSKARQSKYNQATKTVLLISILFLICHTPTGITTGLNILYATKVRTIALSVILVLRKITVIFYEISLCCKFFIYNQTFRNFKVFFHVSLSRFARRTNSAKLGRPILASNGSPHRFGKLTHPCQHYRTFQFAPNKHYLISRGKQNDPIFHNYQRKSSTRTSTSTSKAYREHPHHQSQTHQQPMTVTMLKANNSIQLSVNETPNLLRRYTTGPRISAQNRFLWRGKPQMTL